MKIVRKINDMTVAFGMLALSALVLGGSMLFAGVSGFMYDMGVGVKATNVIVDALMHGSSFFLCGVILMTLCSFTLLPTINKTNVTALWLISNVAVIFSLVSLVRTMLAGAGFSALVSITALVANGVIYFLICYTKHVMDNKEKNKIEAANRLALRISRIDVSKIA